MGLIKCAYARISSKSGPFPLMWTFYTFHAYNIGENWNFGVIAQCSEPDCGPFAFAWDFLDVRT